VPKNEPNAEELDEETISDAPLVDVRALTDAANTRILNMEAAERKPDDIHKTYSSVAKALISAHSEQALSNALVALARDYSAALDARTQSTAYKRHALANEVLSGKFNA
jgi:glycyl-tRNA synthetase beta subunit